MSEHTYKVTEIVGTSPDGIDQAIRNGVERAAQTLRNLDWFEIVEVRGHLQDGAVDHFQVTMKVGFQHGVARVPKGAGRYPAAERDTTRTMEDA